MTNSSLKDVLQIRLNATGAKYVFAAYLQTVLSGYLGEGFAIGQKSMNRAIMGQPKPRFETDYKSAWKRSSWLRFMEFHQRQTSRKVDGDGQRLIASYVATERC